MESGGKCAIIFAIWLLLSNENVFTHGLSDSFVNVAFQKRVSQSILFTDYDYYYYGSPSLAVDGNNSTNISDCSCVEVGRPYSRALWEVDLQDLFQIIKVKIYKRNDSSTELDTSYVISGKLENNTYIQLEKLQKSNSSVVTIDIPSRMRFKAIKIHGENVGMRRVHTKTCLCEVQVLADVDECKEGDSVCTNRGHCNNTEGSFYCGCYEGFIGKNCETVIQCGEILVPNHSRIRYGTGIERMTKSYNSTILMTCDRGYSAVGNISLRCNDSGKWNASLGHCADVDECKAGDSVCNNKGRCTNIEGNFHCRCHEGFTGTNCETDVNECTSRNNACSRNGKCINTWGSFNCQCAQGYTGKVCDTVIQCDEIVVPKHSRIRYETGIERMTKSYNSTILMTCDRGYSAVGNISLRCNDSGKWNGSLGHCAVILCEEVSRPNNSILFIDGGIEGHWTYNTTATVECNQGYTLTGNKMVRCDHSRQWNGIIGYCVDADPCIDGDKVCNNNGHCTNAQGIFNCRCYEGYTGKKCETGIWPGPLFAGVAAAATVPLTIIITLLIIWRRGALRLACSGPGQRRKDKEITCSEPHLRMDPVYSNTVQSRAADERIYEDPNRVMIEMNAYLEPTGIEIGNRNKHNRSKEYENLRLYGNLENSLYTPYQNPS